MKYTSGNNPIVAIDAKKNAILNPVSSEMFSDFIELSFWFKLHIFLLKYIDITKEYTTLAPSEIKEMSSVFRFTAKKEVTIANDTEPNKTKKKGTAISL